MRNTGWLAALALAGFAVAAAAGRAAADPQVDPQIAKADELFAEGRALLSSNLSAACKKFDQSLRYNPAAIGTLLNVALCDEKLGKVATAFQRFSEARDRAKEQGLTDHQQAAEEHILMLRPVVPHLAIALSEPLPDTKVLVDDRVIAHEALDDIAIDPGERVVVVSAPDRLPFRTTIKIGKAERRAVAVPSLSRPPTVTSSWRLIGQISTIGGAAAFGASVGLAVYASRLRGQQLDEGHCSPNGSGGISCDPVGQPKVLRAHTLGTTATVVGSIGLALAAAGTTLWILSPASSRSPGPDVAIMPSVAPDQLGVAAIGRF
jgi:hypothetical protein